MTKTLLRQNINDENIHLAKNFFMASNTPADKLTSILIDLDFHRFKSD